MTNFVSNNRSFLFDREKKLFALFGIITLVREMPTFLRLFLSTVALKTLNKKIIIQIRSHLFFFFIVKYNLLMNIVFSFPAFLLGQNSPNQLIRKKFKCL